MLSMIIAINLMFSMPKPHEVPVTIDHVYSTAVNDKVAVSTGSDLFVFYSAKGDWHDDESATVTMIGDAIVDIR